MCGAVTKFGIFKLLAAGVKADRLKHPRNYFKSVFFLDGKTGEKLEPWNKREYVWPSHLKMIDAFDVLLASFFVICCRPTSPVAIASNLCVLHNIIHTKVVQSRAD